MFTCKVCQRTLPATKLWRSDTCKPCRADARRRAYAEAHPPRTTFTCRRCGGDFSMDQRQPGQVGAICAPCYPEYLKEWRAAHPGRNAELCRARTQRVPDLVQAEQAAYRAIPENAAKAKRRAADYYRDNTARAKRAMVSVVAARRAAKLNATPKWLTKEQHDAMRQLYLAAGELGLTVDHIVPLKSKVVCGLHVPWNLQLLSRAANRAKSNKLETE